MEIPQEIIERYDIRYYHEDNEYIVFEGTCINLPSDGIISRNTENVVEISYPMFIITFWKDVTLIHITVYSVGNRD